MRLSEPRIQPIHESTWDEEKQQIFRGQQRGGNVQNIFRTMANHEKLAKRWLVFGNHVLSKNSLPPREREIVILRVGWLCQSGYEWAQHVIIGKRDGLSEDEISQIKEGATADCWNEHEALLLRAVEELHDDAFITDETWAGISKTYTVPQMMDLVFTVGQYTTVSMALNSFGVQLDDGLEGF